MLTLNDGRSELWQWDTNRKLTVDAECSQVHFSNKVFGRSVDVDVVDGIAVIPDILLQTDKELTAWAFVGTPENGYTKISKVFKVNKRNKPADYVFAPTEQTTLGEILNRIEDLENRPSGDVSKEDIQNAVNDYLDKNPVSVDEKDPTVPAWAKQATKPSYTAKEVGALPNTTVIPVVPSALPNPHKLSLKGAVQAEYDGSEEVTIEITESGGAGGQWRLINTITTTEDALSRVTCTTDSNGNPISLTEVYVKAVLAASSTVSGSNFFYLNNLYFNGPSASTKTGYGSLYANGILNQVSVSNGEYTQWYLHGNRGIPDAPYITKIELCGQSGGKHIPIGTTLQIWGR